MMFSQNKKYSKPEKKNEVILHLTPLDNWKKIDIL